MGLAEPYPPRPSGEATIETEDIRLDRLEHEYSAIRQRIQDLEFALKGLDRMVQGQYERGRILEARVLARRAVKAIASDKTSVGVLRQLVQSLDEAIREMRHLRNTR